MDRWMQDEAPGTAGQDETLGKVDRLMSASCYMSLDAPEEDDGKLVDDVFFREQLDGFFRKLACSWEGKPKLFVRASMSKVLSSIPVIFRSMDELEEYIAGSLESCTDESEKETTMELIRLLDEKDLDFMDE